MKYRRKALVVEVVERFGILAIRSEPDGPLYAISDEDLRQNYERVPDDYVVGCSCSFNETKRVLPNDVGLPHTDSCPLKLTPRT